MLRAFSKALIPIAGLIWVYFSELDIGGASEIGCRTCRMAFTAFMENGDDPRKTHWEWREAITFHQRILSDKLSHS
jgi:hypothetical protein